jgi:ribose 5-phosphate isomerase B
VALRVVAASDHAGFALKTTLIRALEEAGHTVLDLGTDSTEPVDYPDYAEAVGRAIEREDADRGILICGSGVGVCFAANKMPGVRAGTCHDAYSAHQGVEHDNMNVLVLGARVVGAELAKELVFTFLRARFSDEERHRRRLARVQQLEAQQAPNGRQAGPPQTVTGRDHPGTQ